MRLFYLHTDSPTFPHRATLRAAGMKWDSDRKLWYSVDNASAAFGLANGPDLPGWVEEVEASVLPPGFKPRGRAFRKGSDPRRVSASAVAASASWTEPGEPEPTEPTEPEPEPHSGNGNAVEALAAAVRAIAGGAVDLGTVKAEVRRQVEATEAGLRAHIAEALQSQAPRDIRLQVGNLPPVQIGLAHRDLQRIVKRLSIRRADGSRRFPNVRIVGPAGSGKTTLAEQVARALSLSYVYMSAVRSMPESRLEGKRIQNIMTGAEVYVPSSLVSAYTEPTLYLLDEADNLDGSAAVCINMATGNGHWALPDGTVIARHPDMVFMMACNTWGNGQDRQYMREQQDAAFLDRFAGASFYVDYDADVEAAIAPDKALRAEFDRVRKAAAGKVRRILSTRMLSAAHDIMVAEDCTVRAALIQVMPDWTDADLSAVGLR